MDERVESTRKSCGLEVEWVRKSSRTDQVIPAKAGIHAVITDLLDSRFRGNDRIRKTGREGDP